jgi:oligopeptide transport system permease protein
VTPLSQGLARFRKNRPAVAAALVLLALGLACVLCPWLSRFPYDRADLARGATPPSLDHWMGTDTLGRDLMARVFFGGRISVAVGVVATLVSFVIGVTWGTVAGYVGGRADAVMMRIVDVCYTLPVLVFVILIKAFFAGDKTALYRAFRAVLGVFVAHPEDAAYLPVFQVVFIFAALGAVSWLTMARVVRGQVLALRRLPFVEAARAIGAGHAAIVVRHILPNALGPIVVYAALTVP